MKTALFKNSCAPNFIVTKYTGFRGKEKYENFTLEPLPYQNSQNEVYELDPDQLFLPKRVKNIIIKDKKKMMLAVAFMFNNLEKKGNAHIAIDFIGPLADIITLCAQYFKICKIVNDKGYCYLELEQYNANNIIYPDYFKYYFDNKIEDLCPFKINADREKISKIFDCLFKK